MGRKKDELQFYRFFLPAVFICMYFCSLLYPFFSDSSFYFLLYLFLLFFCTVKNPNIFHNSFRLSLFSQFLSLLSCCLISFVLLNRNYLLLFFFFCFNHFYVLSNNPWQCPCFFGLMCVRLFILLYLNITIINYER